jgi:hypothetical protein
MKGNCMNKFLEWVGVVALGIVLAAMFVYGGF